MFTPDDTHYDIIDAALERGLHVMATKPVVKTLKEHQKLVEKAKAKNVLLQIEVHKRFDPIYNDARMRIQKLGNFNFFTSYMSQPKFQLETFKVIITILRHINNINNILILQIILARTYKHYNLLYT